MPRASLKRAEPGSASAGFDGFKVTKQQQGQLNFNPEKTTVEKLSEPVPLALTTLQKLKKFKYKSERNVETVSKDNDSQGQTSGTAAIESQGFQPSKRRKLNDLDQRAPDSKLQNLNCDSEVGAESAKGIDSRLTDPNTPDEHYMAGDELESEPLSQILDDAVLNDTAAANAGSQTCPINLDEANTGFGTSNPANVSSAKATGEISGYFSQPERNDGINTTLLKKPEMLAQHHPDISLPPSDQEMDHAESSVQGPPAEGDEDYGWDDDINALMTAGPLPSAASDETDEKHVISDGDDDGEYGWGDEMDDELMNSAPELVKDSPETLQSNSASPLATRMDVDDEAAESEEYGGWEEGMFDSDGDVFLPEKSAIAAPAILSRSARAMTNKPTEMPAQKAPFKPKIIREIASAEGHLYSYKPVDNKYTGEEASPIIENKGFSLMPASAFESKQPKSSNAKGFQPASKMEFNRPLNSSRFDAIGGMRSMQAATPPPTSPPSRPTRRQVQVAKSSDVIDLTQAPPSLVSPITSRQSLQQWINKSDPTLIISPPSVPEDTENDDTDAEPIQRRSKENKFIVHDNFEDDFRTEEDEEPAQKKWKKNKSNAGDTYSENFGERKKSPWGDDGYSLPPYTNMRYIPDHIVKRYFDIISKPPAEHLSKRKIVNTRPPPEKPMVPINPKRTAFFDLEKVDATYQNERNLSTLTGIVELYVRILDFKTVGREHIITICDLCKKSMEMKGSFPVGRVPPGELAWLDGDMKPNGKPAVVVGYLRTVDMDPFIDITAMRERTWPEIAEASLMAGEFGFAQDYGMT